MSMTSVDQHPHEWRDIDFVGGVLCLDFANTVNAWLGEECRGDYLKDFCDLVRWGVRSGALDADLAPPLLAAAEERVGEATAILEEARNMRGVLRRVFLARADGEMPDAGDIEALNNAVSWAMSHLELTADNGGFGWAWHRDRQPPLDRVLWPVARSAADLLTSADPRRLKTCPADDCGWMFYDTSKAGRRRWCDMSTCGNRAKAHRHYRKKKAGDC